MVRAIVTVLLLVLGAVALARGLYLQGELTRQLDTGTMGVVRSWIMWSTTDGRELVAWYRQVTPWLIWGGSGTLMLGLLIALWPTSLPSGAAGAPGKASRDKGAKAATPQRKARGSGRSRA